MAQKPAGQSCVNCMYYVITGTMPTPPAGQGRCRCYPPVLRVHSDVPENLPLDATYWQFPIVAAADWCGRWAAIPTE